MTKAFSLLAALLLVAGFSSANIIVLYTNQTGTSDGYLERCTTHSGQEYARHITETECRVGLRGPGAPACLDAGGDVGDRYAAFFYFNASAIPDTATIDEVNFTAQVTVAVSDSNCGVRHLDANTSAYADNDAGNGALWTDINNGSTYNYSNWCLATGSKPITFNSQAVSDLANAVASGKIFGLGVNSSEDNTAFATPEGQVSSSEGTASQRPYLTVRYTPDTLAPQWSNNNTNSTLAGQAVLFVVNWTDNKALANATFELDNGNGTLQNRSYLNFTGTFNQSNFTATLDATAGSLVRWRVYAWDRAGNANSTPQFLFTSTEPDNEAPKWDRNFTNGTRAATNITFGVHWTDNAALSQFIFSFDNGSGVFINDSALPLLSAENWTNVTKLVNLTGGSVLRWQVYATDANGNMNSTPIFVLNATYNPVGGSDAYVAFQGQVYATINATGGPSLLKRPSGRIPNATVYVTRAGSSIDWGQVKAASVATDMPAINTFLSLSAPKDLLNWNYNASVRDGCRLSGVNMMNSSDGNFFIGSLYSDEDASGGFNAGDIVIFCVDVNYNSENYAGARVDYEIAVPGAMGALDFYVEAG